MRHRWDHAAIHTTKGLTAFPISKCLFFWIINGMSNQNRWCCSTSPQQWCILPCSAPTLLTLLGAPAFQAPQALLKALLENFPGERTREQSQHNEGSRAVQHMAFCTCAGRTTCTSFVDSSEKAWPQTRWPWSWSFSSLPSGTYNSPSPSTISGLYSLSASQTAPLLILQTTCTGARESCIRWSTMTLQGGWGLGFLVGLVGVFVGWFLFGVSKRNFYIFCKFFYGVTALKEVWC